MRLISTASKFRLAMLLGATTGLTAGCVLTLGAGDPHSCGGTFSNSDPQNDGTCACDPGYDWCNPGDASDYECCGLDACDSGNDNYVDGQGMCKCDAGFDWCNPSDSNDLSCCESATTSGTGEVTSGDGDGDGDGDSSTSGDGDGDNLPPETCTEAEEGLEWCTKDAGDDLSGSRYFFCLEGLWTEFPMFLDQTCVDDGFDFAYGCEYDGTKNDPVCGVGTGAACNDGDAATCPATETLEFCEHSRLGSRDCVTFCENGIENGLAEDFEFGECEVVADVADCTCWNTP